MDQLREYPETEKEILDAHLCGCGTVGDLIAQASKIVKEIVRGDKCTIWDMCLVDMVHQLYINQLALHFIREEGKTVGLAKAYALQETLSGDVQKIMEVAQEHIKKTVIGIVDDNSEPPEHAGHAKH